MGAERPPADTLRLVILGGEAGEGAGSLQGTHLCVVGGGRSGKREKRDIARIKQTGQLWDVRVVMGRGGGFKLQVLFMDGLYQG